MSAGRTMLAAMIDRAFLGWDRPFLTRAVAWLLERRETLPEILVVVPTAQSGRRLREALAEATGALLSPKIATPGSFLKARDGEAAADWIERVAWVEVLESNTDESAFDGIFPEAPGEDTNWTGGFAREMVQLRHSLQENGLTLSTAARKLSDTMEAERWDALARLENLVEEKLQSWSLKSRSRILAGGLEKPEGISHIVVAGVADLPPLVERAWLAWGIPMTVLIGAPTGESEHFSQIGRPMTTWSDRALPRPSSMQVVADPQQQAVEALRVVGTMKNPSNEVALASADSEVGDELARTFTRAGWVTFHPAAAAIDGGLSRWFRIWSKWLADPTLATLADLLSLPETGVLVAGKRAQKAKSLAELRDRWMISRTEDLQRRIAEKKFRNPQDEESAMELCKAAEALEAWRGSFLGGQLSATMQRLLASLGRTGSTTKEASNMMADWISEAAPMMERVKRGPGFWIELMLSEQPPPSPLPPPGRVLDVQGWLELFHEPGRHLILCGMNEGKVPARSGGEPWLCEQSRKRLGLIQDADRAARDAFLYASMVEARRDGGRVDVICGKSGLGGEPLLPSRILLACHRDELPERVKTLFKEVEPPEAGLRWQADWQWNPRTVAPPQRLNVTSLGDYLSCPFRYYLKHVLKMQNSEAGRAEWNARDFGNVAHEVMERWGRDTDARDSTKPDAIHRWLSSELDQVVAEWFGKRIPLAIRIQTEALRQRFVWLSRTQATSRSEGWEITDVERKIELPIGDALMVAKIDRIDRHSDSGQLRVIDYKTGKVDGVEKSHRKRLIASSTIPMHLSQDCPAIYRDSASAKPADFLWHNLQLPLYASALVADGLTLPEPCYFTLRSTESEVAIHTWDNFENADLEAARSCAEWVAGQIAAAVFWPPAEKVTYDDFEVLAAGRNFEEMFDHG